MSRFRWVWPWLVAGVLVVLAVLRIDLAGLRRAGYEIPSPTRVSNTVSSGGRAYLMPGGGDEMQFPYAIPPEFIKVVPR